MTNYDNLPLSLRERPQWVVWRYETRDAGKKPTKVPYCGVTGAPASVTNPATWASYAETCAAVYAEPNLWSGIGFVLTALDPFAVIDLDDVDDVDLKLRQANLITAFDSYTEISPSGKGHHIIVRGEVEKGRNRRPLEIYSTARFFTCTGNVYLDRPIADRQDLLVELWEELAPKSASSLVCHDGNSPQTQSDDAVCSAAYSASNGKKFYALYMGNWNEYYASQSEADFALIDILAFYTKNAAQIERIFLASALGQRDKAKRPDYLPTMIQRSFDRMLPEVSLDALLDGLAQRSAPTNIDTVVGDLPQATLQRLAVPDIQLGSLPFVHDAYSKPVGMVGDIAQYIYDAAPRPVAELALAGALGFMAGICGKAFNVSGTGLNQYLVTIATTGIGKEAVGNGISALVNMVTATSPSVEKFIGPSDMASAQGVLNYMSEGNTCFVSLIGECGMWLSNLSSAKANGVQVGLRRLLLDAYGKSGHSGVIRPTVYADKTKNTKVIKSPALTILGDSTPEKFFEVITPDLLAEGLVSRFMLIHYQGKRPRLNRQMAAAVPERGLIEMLSALCQQCHAIIESGKVIDIQLDPAADNAAMDYNEYCDDLINDASSDVVRQLWSRAYLKMLKVAALIAIGRNIYQPVISTDDVKWASQMVNFDIAIMLEKFNTGEMGTLVQGVREDNKQLELALKVTQEFIGLEPSRMVSYGVTASHVENRCIPWAYYQRRLYGLKLFSRDPRGSAGATLAAIKGLADQGVIVELSQPKTIELFNSTAKTYCVM